MFPCKSRSIRCTRCTHWCTSHHTRLCNYCHKLWCILCIRYSLRRFPNKRCSHCKKSTRYNRCSHQYTQSNRPRSWYCTRCTRNILKCKSACRYWCTLTNKLHHMPHSKSADNRRNSCLRTTTRIHLCKTGSSQCNLSRTLRNKLSNKTRNSRHIRYRMNSHHTRSIHSSRWTRSHRTRTDMCLCKLPYTFLHSRTHTPRCSRCGSRWLLLPAWSDPWSGGCAPSHSAHGSSHPTPSPRPPRAGARVPY